MKPTLQRLHELSVLVVIPSTGVWAEPFGISLCNMVKEFFLRRIGAYKNQVLYTASIKGSILPKSRWSTLNQAKKSGVDYLLYIDSDQSFPKDLIHRLVMRDVDVVAANIATKTMPTMPTARSKPKEGDPGYGAPVFTDADSHGLEQVWRIGCGIMMLSKKVIQALPPGCFDIKWRADAENYQGEDWSLCEAIEELGFPIYIDHDLSNQVGHHGTFNFTHEYNGELKEVENGQVIHGAG